MKSGEAMHDRAVLKTFVRSKQYPRKTFSNLNKMVSGGSDQFQAEYHLKREHYLYYIAAKSLKEVIRPVFSRIDTFCAWEIKRCSSQSCPKCPTFLHLRIINKYKYIQYIYILYYCFKLLISCMYIIINFYNYSVMKLIQYI